MICRNQMLAFASLSSLAIGLCASPAFAQDQAPAAPEQDVPTDAPDPADDSEIVVTAQKRGENIQDVPISIAAFSDETLEQANVLDRPGSRPRSLRTSGRQGRPDVLVRLKFAASAPPATRPSSRASPSSSTASTFRAPARSSARCWTWRASKCCAGPQGTLFGRNASVGALSLRTARAGRRRSPGEVTGEIGNGDRYKLSGYRQRAGQRQCRGPHRRPQPVVRRLLDQRARRRAARRRRRSGDPRGSVEAEFGAVEWVVRADYSAFEGDGFTNIDFDPTSCLGAQLAASAGAARRQLPDTDLDDRMLNQFVTADLEDRQWGVSSTLSYDIGGGDLRLINSYRDWKNDQLDGDVIFTPVPIASRTATTGRRATTTSSSSSRRAGVAGRPPRSRRRPLLLLRGVPARRAAPHEQPILQRARPGGPGRNACNGFLRRNGGLERDRSGRPAGRRQLRRLRARRTSTSPTSSRSPPAAAGHGREGRRLCAAHHQSVRRRRSARPKC